MKRLLLMVLFIPMFAHSQTPPSDRWSLIFEDKTANSKWYIDTQTIDQLEYFEGHANIYSAWLKHLSDFSSGVYHKEDIQHMVIDMNMKQFGIKSVVSRKDGVNVQSETFKYIQWSDVVPESNSEIVLNYCKNLHR